MIVYGDCVRRTTLGSVIAELEATLAEPALAPAASSPVSPEMRTADQLDRARRTLVVAGCLEQAVEDGIERREVDPEIGPPARLLTDLAANAFLAEWRGSQGDPVQRLDDASWREVVASFDRFDRDTPLAVTSPEGFACYTLYPDQYAAAALAWADRSGPDARPVGVVGIRTIGTTLSAVVAGVLASRGLGAIRVTVRPGGPTDARVVTAPGAGDVLAGVGRVLVVDEGPGLSGSSMASAVIWLRDLGLADADISLLPGHAGEPGSSASAAVRAVWANIHRQVCPLTDLRWWGRSLPEMLAWSTPQLFSSPAEVAHVDDLSGGRWREVVDSAEPPLASPAFERTKYRVRLADGSAVLWKYAGLDDRRTMEQMTQRWRSGWGLQPLGRRAGFIAVPWIEGPVPTSTDAGPALTDTLAAYILSAAQPPMPVAEQVEAVERLGRLLYWNVWETLGEPLAAVTCPLATELTTAASTSGSAVAGDGRMGPENWRRLGDGRLTKINATTHDDDHTAVGRQSIAWDVAGAIIDWDLDDTSRHQLIASVAAGGHQDAVAEPWLLLHELAYAAFRLGQLLMSGPDPSAAGERARSAACERYRTRLVTALEAMPPAIPRC